MSVKKQGPSYHFTIHPDSKPSEYNTVSRDTSDPKRGTKVAVCSGLVNIDRRISRLGDNEATALLLLCKVGEDVDMGPAQTLLFRKALASTPEPFTFHSWLEQLLSLENGVLRSNLLNATNIKFIYGNIPKPEMTAIKDTAFKLYETVEKSREILLKLSQVMPHEVSWERLNEIGLRPITASFYLMHTRVCEHVALTRQVLEWAAEFPDKDSLKRRQPFVYPEKAPEDWSEYMDLEVIVRRLQRVVFPGMTSQEVNAIIHAGRLGLLR
jgi:hypothetical protein